MHVLGQSEDITAVPLKSNGDPKVHNLFRLFVSKIRTKRALC